MSTPTIANPIMLNEKDLRWLDRVGNRTGRLSGFTRAAEANASCGSASRAAPSARPEKVRTSKSEGLLAKRPSPKSG